MHGVAKLKARGASAMTSQPTKQLLQAFIASEEMDNAACHLRAGRRLAHLSDEALKVRWASAWRLYYDEYQPDLWPACSDADAELTLRRLSRPEHLIPPWSRKRIVARLPSTVARMVLK
jgi:hypothetical protein